MYKVEVVRTVAAHIDDIMIVENLSFRIPWSRKSMEDEITHNRMAVYFSALINNKTVGYAGMWKVFDEGHITNIAVHPEYRRSGIGSALLEHLIKTAEQSGIGRMTLEVRKSNLAAQYLYRKYGFMEGGIRKAYYADNQEDALIMWRESSMNGRAGSPKASE